MGIVSKVEYLNSWRGKFLLSINSDVILWKKLTSPIFSVAYVISLYTLQNILKLSPRYVLKNATYVVVRLKRSATKVNKFNTV